jgi:hypothetical protein
MKKIYSILLICFGITAVWAQSPNKKFSFLVKGGLNISNYAVSEPKIYIIKDDFEDKNNLGFNVSAASNYKISNSVALQMGLGFSQKGYTQQFDVDLTLENEISLVKFREKMTQRIYYLEVPLNVLYNYKKFSFGLGPYLAYTITANSTNAHAFSYPETREYKWDLKIGNDENSVVKPLDFGFNFLADYKLKYGISVGLNYGLGLTNASMLALGSDGKNRVFSILVGYNF